MSMSKNSVQFCRLCFEAGRYARHHCVRIAVFSHLDDSVVLGQTLPS